MRAFDEGSKAATPAMGKILQSIRHPVRFVLEHLCHVVHVTLDRALCDIHENARLVFVYASPPILEYGVVSSVH